MESTSSWPHWVFVPWKLLGLIEAVVESVWQPAVARAASRAIITGCRSCSDTQLLSSVQFTVLLSQSCVKNLALCRITWEDLKLLEFQPVCCAWGSMLWLPWLLELSTWEAKFSANLCFNIQPLSFYISTQTFQRKRASPPRRRSVRWGFSLALRAPCFPARSHDIG